MSAARKHVEKLKEMGRPIEEQLNTWTTAFAAHDFFTWQTMKEKLGYDKALDVYKKIWEKLDVSGVEAAKKSLGITKVDVPELGKIAKHIFESIVCPYAIEKDSDREHVGNIQSCVFWDIVEENFGQAFPKDVIKEYGEVQAKTSDNAIKAIVAAVGLQDKVEGGMDQFICTDDNVCRVYFKKK